MNKSLVTLQLDSVNHSRFLQEGTETNKGVINKIIHDIHTRYNTISGSYHPDELIIRINPDDPRISYYEHALNLIL